MNLFNNKNKRETIFVLSRVWDKERSVLPHKESVSKIFALQGSDPPQRLCVELGHEVIGDLDFLNFLSRFLYRVQNLSSLSFCS